VADESKWWNASNCAIPLDTLQPVATPDCILKCQEAVRRVNVPSEVCDYILKIVRATREHPALLLGSSPRGSLGLFRRAGDAAISGEIPYPPRK